MFEAVPGHRHRWHPALKNKDPSLKTLFFSILSWDRFPVSALLTSNFYISMTPTNTSALIYIIYGTYISIFIIIYIPYHRHTVHILYMICVCVWGGGVRACVHCTAFLDIDLPILICRICPFLCPAVNFYTLCSKLCIIHFIDTGGF